MAEAQPRSLLQAVPKSLFAIQQGVFQKAAPSLSDFCFQSEERDSAYGFRFLPGLFPTSVLFSLFCSFF